ARADREVVEILAAAQRESEILRGEGEAERNAIFASAFERDQDFFEFYRSMAAYRVALDPAGTTMLLNPNTEFFQFFNDPSGNGTGTNGGATGTAPTVTSPAAPAPEAAPAQTPAPAPTQ